MWRARKGLISYLETEGERNILKWPICTPSKPHRNQHRQQYQGPYKLTTPHTLNIYLCFKIFPFLFVLPCRLSLNLLFHTTLGFISTKLSAPPCANMFPTPFYCNKSGQHLQAWAHSLLLFEITLNTYRIAVALVSSSSNRVLFSKTYDTGLLLWSKISALQHIRFGPDWPHHSVQGVFWDNETRKWLKYLVWQRETLSRAVLLSGCGFSYCKSCTVWSPCSLATALSQSGAKITAERLEVVRSALLHLPSQSFPHMWFNPSRWTAHAVFTVCFPPECKAVGNWCKWGTRTCDSTRNSVLHKRSR